MQQRTVAKRASALDWTALTRSIGELGYARTGGFLTPEECADTIALYDRENRYRKTIDMGRHGYGEGQYRYFQNPLPALVRHLRQGLYRRLAPFANAMMADLGRDIRYPERLDSFLEFCHARGQARPTPLLLRYHAGGYNRMHRDLYGEVRFPLQATICLSRPGVDYTGGAFLLTEQRPRQQTRAEAIDLVEGEMILFPTADRPVIGKRGVYRAQMRHGVSRLLSGQRFALGIIFHDAA